MRVSHPAMSTAASGDQCTELSFTVKDLAESYVPCVYMFRCGFPCLVEEMFSSSCFFFVSELG